MKTNRTDGRTFTGAELLAALGFPAGFTVSVRVPGGGDWSNTDLEISEETLLQVYHTKSSFIIDPIDHVSVLVYHAINPWSRVECKCGHKSAWLKWENLQMARGNDWMCLPCPLTNVGTRLYFVITVMGWGTLYGFGTVAEAEVWRAHKARWERAVARKRIATTAEIATNEFDDLSALLRLRGKEET